MKKKSNRHYYELVVSLPSHAACTHFDVYGLKKNNLNDMRACLGHPDNTDFIYSYSFLHPAVRSYGPWGQSP